MSNNDLSASYFALTAPNVEPETPAVTLQHDELKDLKIGTKALNFAAIVIPFIGLAAGVVLMWGWGITWLELTMLVVGYVLTAGGVTIGYHRYFTHKSYECRRWVQWVIGILASSSMQGTLFGWVATHRCHHQHSDRPGDPHSPHLDDDDHHIGDGVKGLLKGLWRSHMGWLFEKQPENLARYIPDLVNDPVARPVSKLFPLWVVVGMVVPAIIGGLYHQTWLGVLLGFCWGGLARIFVVHHVTWSINSACHIWGKRTYNSPDHSKNNVFFGVLALGEGWHNNHHTFPASARHGLEWWQLDLTYITIKAMSWVGLAWDINLPKPERIKTKTVGG